MSKDLSSTKERKKLSAKEFALPDKRKYPIPDKAHARNALARVAQNGTSAEQKQVRAAVHRRYPDIGDDANDKKSAGKSDSTKKSSKKSAGKSGASNRSGSSKSGSSKSGSSKSGSSKKAASGKKS